MIISGNKFAFLLLFLKIMQWAQKRETNAESNRFFIHYRNNYRKLVLFLEIITEMAQKRKTNAELI